MKWALMEKTLPKMYVNLIEDIYEGVSTKVKNLYGENEDFSIRLGMHQVSALSFY